MIEKKKKKVYYIARVDEEKQTYAVLIHVRSQSFQLYQQIVQMQATFSHSPQQLTHSHITMPSGPGSTTRIETTPN